MRRGAYGRADQFETEPGFTSDGVGIDRMYGMVDIGMGLLRLSGHCHQGHHQRAEQKMTIRMILASS
ncbi:MAG: hypothetical protein QF726_04175 [Alphaproteobacteria bacterium]|nr:hypothetical protein [Alphaproteobacteria bacterium]